MKGQDIIDAIISKVGNISYSSWTIGVTDNPVERKSSHAGAGHDVASWQHWATNTETEGRAVETYFLSKGMKGDDGGGGNAGYVYIF